MAGKRIVETLVGIFMILGLLAFFMLALKVSGIDFFASHNAIKVTAAFDDIGDLKVRAPVKVAGVRIGEVSNIVLDPTSYRAEVTMFISNGAIKIPVDSSASILSASLLGSNYISISPGFDSEILKNNGVIEETHPAVILENLLGQAMFTPKDSEEKK